VEAGRQGKPDDFRTSSCRLQRARHRERAAACSLGDYCDEAAILLLLTFGHWLPQLQFAGLITILGDIDGEGLWAHINWSDLEAAVRIGTMIGNSGERRVLQAAASLADGHPVDLGDLAADLDRRALTLVLAAIAHAAGSHEQRATTRGADGIPHPGDPLPPLVTWPWSVQ
jgi:hypothetical protein